MLAALGFVGFFVGGILKASPAESIDIGPLEGLVDLVAAPARDDIARQVRAQDPGFSLVLFEDFAYALYAESQRARHDPRALAGLSPYWSKDAQAALAERPPLGGKVESVVVGALTPSSVELSGTRLNLRYFFETNLHVGPAPGGANQGQALTQYVTETWTFSRELSASTKPWSGVRKLGCPNCGAPLGQGGDVRCPSCGEATGEGRFDWQVIRVSTHRVENRPHSLTGNVEEVGTDAPTQFAPSLRPQIEQLYRDDPGLDAKSIEARLRLIFTTLQSAWAAQDLRPLRPFVSDRQYDSLQYWIDAYKAQGLRNLMERPRLNRFVLARVERDQSYDALTLRIWASGCDYTINANGDVVGGSCMVERLYSEYWTLIRSAKVRGTPRLDHNCPGCGAPFQLNMAGQCEQCGVHLTSGEFDWVLSRIEQDESYRG